MDVHGFTSVTEGFSGVLEEKEHSSADCSPVVDESEEVTLGANGRKSSRALSEAATCDDNQSERGGSVSPSYRCDGEGEKTRRRATAKPRSVAPIPNHTSCTSSTSIHAPFQSPRMGAPVHVQQALEKCISRSSDGLSRCNSSSDAAGVCGRGTCLILGSCICSQKKEPK